MDSRSPAPGWTVLSERGSATPRTDEGSEDEIDSLHALPNKRKATSSSPKKSRSQKIRRISQELGKQRPHAGKYCGIQPQRIPLISNEANATSDEDDLPPYIGQEFQQRRQLRRTKSRFTKTLDTKGDPVTKDSPIKGLQQLEVIDISSSSDGEPRAVHKILCPVESGSAKSEIIVISDDDSEPGSAISPRGNGQMAASGSTSSNDLTSTFAPMTLDTIPQRSLSPTSSQEALDALMARLVDQSCTQSDCESLAQSSPVRSAVADGISCFGSMSPTSPLSMESILVIENSKLHDSDDSTVSREESLMFSRPSITAHNDTKVEPSPGTFHYRSAIGRVEEHMPKLSATFVNWRPGRQDEALDGDADGLWAPLYRERPSLRARAWVRQQGHSNPRPPPPHPTICVSGGIAPLFTQPVAEAHIPQGAGADVYSMNPLVSGAGNSATVPHADASNAPVSSHLLSPSIMCLRSRSEQMFSTRSEDSDRRFERGSIGTTLSTVQNPFESVRDHGKGKGKPSGRPDLGYLRKLFRSSGLCNEINSSQVASTRPSPIAACDHLDAQTSHPSSEVPSDDSPFQMISTRSDNACQISRNTATMRDADLTVLNVKIPDRLAESAESVSPLQSPLVNGVPEGTTSLAVFRNYIEVLTWPQVKDELLRSRRPCLLAKNLPHAFEDNMNALMPEFRQLAEMRRVFEAMMIENTALDEPDAPPIHVYNEHDSSPHPDWEFHYSNHMWLGEGVPGPDLENLVGCDCKGSCRPRIRPCQCSDRQRSFYLELDTDFIFNSDGTLNYHNVPIHECNDLCSCDETCPNRVVQHGRKCEINIVKTANKGWGVFAGSKRIAGGTFVGIYAGELLTDEAAHERGTQYDRFGRTYLLDIDIMRDENGDRSNKYTVDAYHAGNFTRFLNHSCEPNCNINPVYWNDAALDRPLLALFTERDIEPWEELCFSYCTVDEDSNKPTSHLPIHSKCYCGAPGCRGIMFA